MKLSRAAAGPIRFLDLGVILSASGWESLARSAAEILSRSSPESPPNYEESLKPARIGAIGDQSPLVLASDQR